MSLPVAPYTQPSMLVDSTGNQSEGVNKVAVYYWDSNTLAWVKATGGAIPGANVNVTNFPAIYPISAVSLPLPTGAATETTLSTRVADTTVTSRLGTLGQKTMTGSTPVVLASDQYPILQESLIGNANNYYPNKKTNFVIGRSSSVNNALVDLWEGPTPTYVFPTVGQQFSVVSTSANDTAAGTGARTVIIHALDSSYNPIDVTITLNGLTPVLTTQTNLFRINGFHVTSIGTVNGTAAGTISVTNTAGTTTYATILPGSNTAHQGIFTIPTGTNGYLNHWQASSGTATGTHFTRVQIRATMHSAVLYPGVFLVVDEQGTLNNGENTNYPIPIRFPPQTDIKLSAISDAGSANAVVMGAMYGWLE